MDLVDDLKKIQQIKPSDFEEICDVLNKRSSTDQWAISLAKLEKKIGQDTVQHLSRFLTFLADNLLAARDYEARLERINLLISSIVQDDPGAGEAWARVRDSLESLEPYFQSKKEEEIRDRFKRITNFVVTTDIRPLMDAGKHKIVKTMITNILKITTTDGESYICEFYEDDLDGIIEELELAKKKMALFKECYTL